MKCENVEWQVVPVSEKIRLHFILKYLENTSWHVQGMNVLKHEYNLKYIVYIRKFIITLFKQKSTYYWVPLIK